MSLFDSECESNALVNVYKTGVYIKQSHIWRISDFYLNATRCHHVIFVIRDFVTDFNNFVPLGLN